MLILLRHPIGVALFFVGVVALGVFALLALPASALPMIDSPIIQITTLYPGASPAVAETNLTTPLEYFVGRISGLKRMSSISSYGASVVTLEFSLSKSISVAAQDVQAAINAAAGWIPVGLLPSPPTYEEVNPGEAPILIIALSSTTVSHSFLAQFAGSSLTQKLSQVTGVGAVSIEGNEARAIRLNVNPWALGGHGLSLEDVHSAITTATTDISKGQIDSKTQSLLINTNDQLFGTSDYLNAVIAVRQGAPIHLRDVAKVEESTEDVNVNSRFNSKDAIIVDIQRQPGANAIRVSDELKVRLQQIRAELPGGIDLTVVTDRTASIRAALADVKLTLFVSCVLVVIVIFIFLGNLRATIIPAVTVPITLLATCGLMAISGFSLNVLSLMSMTISCGFIVDDAIVVVENISRFLESGKSAIDAAQLGTREIRFTIISLTVSLIAVFIPLILMEGLIGRLFREFALTLSFSVVISGAISLILTPVMCAHLLGRDNTCSGHNAVETYMRSIFHSLVRWYSSTLWNALRNKNIVLLCLPALVIGVIWLYQSSGKDFLPIEDTGLLVGVTRGAPNVSAGAMRELQADLERAFLKNKNVRTTVGITGVGSMNYAQNIGRIYVNIGDPVERDVPEDIMVSSLMSLARRIPDLSVQLRPIQDLALETRVTGGDYQYVLSGPLAKDVLDYGERIVAAMRRTSEFINIAFSQHDVSRQMVLHINRLRAARLGVSVDSIDQTLYDAFGQRQISTVFGSPLDYRVVLGLTPDGVSLRQLLDLLLVHSEPPLPKAASPGAVTVVDQPQTSSLVPLSSLIDATFGDAPTDIEHENALPSGTISFGLQNGVALSEGLRTLTEIVGETGLPSSLRGDLRGTSEELSSGLSGQVFLLLASVLSMYLILGVLYESFVHPLTILSSLPPACFGALVGIRLCGESLNLISIVGMVLLIGLVKKNGILMVDFAITAERVEGLSKLEAIHRAALLRFRPIMMTTMAALLGALPLMFATGVGAELRRPLGVSMIGGLVVSQVVTLFLTPVIYVTLGGAANALRVSVRSMLGGRG